MKPCGGWGRLVRRDDLLEAVYPEMREPIFLVLPTKINTLGWLLGTCYLRIIPCVSLLRLSTICSHGCQWSLNTIDITQCIYIERERKYVYVYVIIISSHSISIYCHAAVAVTWHQTSSRTLNFDTSTLRHSVGGTSPRTCFAQWLSPSPCGTQPCPHCHPAVHRSWWSCGSSMR